MNSNAGSGRPRVHPRLKSLVSPATTVAEAPRPAFANMILKQRHDPPVWRGLIIRNLPTKAAFGNQNVDPSSREAVSDLLVHAENGQAFD